MRAQHMHTMTTKKAVRSCPQTTKYNRYTLGQRARLEASASVADSRTPVQSESELVAQRDVQRLSRVAKSTPGHGIAAEDAQSTKWYQTRPQGNARA